jgi:hypothetical protein
MWSHLVNSHFAQWRMHPRPMTKLPPPTLRHSGQDHSALGFIGDAIVTLAEENHSRVLTLEDNDGGGFGSAVAAVLAEYGGPFTGKPLSVRQIPKSGRIPDDVLRHVKLSVDDIVTAVDGSATAPRSPIAKRGGEPLRYEVNTKLTTQEALERAINFFGRGGQGLEVRSRGDFSLVFLGGGGYVAITALPGDKTTIDLETREWDWAVRQFMEKVH